MGRDSGQHNYQGRQQAFTTHVVLAGLLAGAAWTAQACSNHAATEQHRMFEEFKALKSQKQSSSAQQHEHRHQRQLLQSTTTGTTMRFDIDFSPLAASGLDSSTQASVTQLVNTAVNSFKKFLKIKVPVSGNLLVLGVRPYCYLPTVTIPDSKIQGKGTGKPVDYYLFVTYDTDASRCPSGVQAYAAACEFDSSTNRPLAGTIALCPTLVSKLASGGSNVGALVHELIHALGFYKSLIQGGWIDQTTGNEYSTPIDGNAYLITPKVAIAARLLSNCSTLPGALLEQSGGDAAALSHWEERVYYQEMMAPVATTGIEQRLSALTLAAMEDSGWYLPRYAFAQPVDKLAGGGCDLVTMTCTNYIAKYPSQPFFCPAAGNDNAQCFSPTKRVGCGNNAFADGCLTMWPGIDCADMASRKYFGSASPVNSDTSKGLYLGFGQYLGDAGRCLTIQQGDSQRVAACFKTYCDADNNPYVVGMVPKADASGNRVWVDVNMPCPVGTTLAVNRYINFNQVLQIACPAAGYICDSSATAKCRTSCKSGTCTNGACICTLEAMGPNCDVSANSVTDFDAAAVQPADAAMTVAIGSDAASLTAPGALLPCAFALTCPTSGGASTSVCVEQVPGLSADKGLALDTSTPFSALDAGSGCTLFSKCMKLPSGSLPAIKFAKQRADCASGQLFATVTQSYYAV